MKTPKNIIKKPNFIFLQLSTGALLWEDVQKYANNLGLRNLDTDESDVFTMRTDLPKGNFVIFGNVIRDSEYLCLESTGSGRPRFKGIPYYWMQWTKEYTFVFVEEDRPLFMKKTKPKPTSNWAVRKI